MGLMIPDGRKEWGKIMDSTVLVVEDNELNMKLIQHLLTVGKYQILKAGSAEEGIELARANRPSLILMDIQLPGMDGLDATRVIKSDPSMRKIPVVALTSFAMAGDEQKAMEAGCEGYITKPISTRTFLQELSVFIEA
ncbi:MAG: response regulator [Syntrophobacteraceae bacterium]|nr:response regulator [Syntrophobacteraceae bacterium]